MATVPDASVWQALLTLLCSYLLGCFCSGYYLVKAVRGCDIRGTASGNAGSRNVGRLLGAKGFAVTLAGDAGKGALAVWFAHSVNPDPRLAFAALLAVTAGHIWPAQLGFRGGKGFATLAGGMALLDPVLFLVTGLFSLVFMTLRRGTTAAGLLALALSPATLMIERFLAGYGWLSPELLLYGLLVAVVLHAHRMNIRAALNLHAAPGEHG